MSALLTCTALGIVMGFALGVLYENDYIFRRFDTVPKDKPKGERVDE